MRYCYPHVRSLIPDTRVIALIASSLTRVENYGGEYFDINCGISRGSPLSPLLGSIFLKPLDDAMENLGVFYVRYVDEGCIMAKSKFKLRHAIKKMHLILKQLRLKTHTDKTFIGSVEKSFSFLGYQFCNKQLRRAQASFEKLPKSKVYGFMSNKRHLSVW